MNYKNNIIIVSILIIILLVIGTGGYMIIEKDNPERNWGFLDGIYMTIITLTTVGYGDMGMSDDGRTFTLFLLIGGVGVFTYSVSVATAFLIEGQLHSLFKQQRMIKNINKLSNHYIICGLGNTGTYIIDEMLKAGVNFVGIELEEERLTQLSDTRNFLYLHGDATNDDLLLRAGIDRAQGLIACLNRDQENLFVVISARELNPQLKIAAKAIEHNSSRKLISAGADEVVLSDQIGGMRLAIGVLKPQLISFLENIAQDQQGTKLNQSIIQEESCLNGTSLKDANIQGQTGLVVIAIQSGDGKSIYNPHQEIKIKAGDALVVIADQNQIQKLHELTGDHI